MNYIFCDSTIISKTEHRCVYSQIEINQWNGPMPMTVCNANGLFPFKYVPSFICFYCYNLKIKTNNTKIMIRTSVCYLIITWKSTIIFGWTWHLFADNCVRSHINTSLICLCSLCQVTHYRDVIMIAMASQITSLTIVYSNVYLGADQRKYQSSMPLIFVRGFHRWLVNSPHKGPVSQKLLPFDDVIVN